MKLDRPLRLEHPITGKTVVCEHPLRKIDIRVGTIVRFEDFDFEDAVSYGGGSTVGMIVEVILPVRRFILEHLLSGKVGPIQYPFTPIKPRVKISRGEDGWYEESVRIKEWFGRISMQRATQNEVAEAIESELPIFTDHESHAFEKYEHARRSLVSFQERSKRYQKMAR